MSLKPSTVPFQFFSSAGILMFYGSLLLLYYLGFGQQKRVLTLLCQLTLVSVVAQYGYQFIKVLFDPKSTTFWHFGWLYLFTPSVRLWSTHEHFGFVPLWSASKHGHSNSCFGKHSDDGLVHWQHCSMARHNGSAGMVPHMHWWSTALATETKH